MTGTGRCGKYTFYDFCTSVQCDIQSASRTMQITSVISALLQTAVAVLMMSQSGTEAVPAEGLTPFGFLMARAYGQPAVHPVMRNIVFKPSDGAKFREAFEKKHGPRGRDLIDSLGRGSYKTGEATASNRFPNVEDIAIAGEASSKSLVVVNPSEALRLKQ